MPISHLRLHPLLRSIFTQSSRPALLSPGPQFTAMSTPPPPPLISDDVVAVRDLALVTSKAGLDTWHRAGRRQPVFVNCIVRGAAVAVSGVSDLVEETIHYGQLTKAVTKVVESDATGETTGTRALALEIISAVHTLGGANVCVRLTFPKKLLRADAAGVEVTRHRYVPYGLSPVVHNVADTAFVDGLHVYSIIGVNPWERLEKQEVVIGFTARQCEDEVDVVALSNDVINITEKSAYLTIEALVSALAKFLCFDKNLPEVTVRASKPRAIAFAAGPTVEITRSRRYYTTRTPGLSSEKHIAYLGMGSNLGDRAALLSASLEELEKRNVKVLRTASMFESAPMYVENQPRFLNSVCEVETTLTPHELLLAVQDVEKNALGRVKLIDKGPRTIDLDILLYDDVVVRDGAILSIPHLGLLEREFALRPLVQLAPDYVHPVTTKTIEEHFRHICPDRGFVSDMYTVVPLKHPRGSKVQMMFDAINHTTMPTHVMGILNITPDSFSDAGVNLDLQNMLQTAREFVSANKNVIFDIGGQSTNPKSTDPGPKIETERVVPAIKLLRSLPEFDETIISIDTFYASVAKAAIEAGADIINDVSAGDLDADMLATAAELDVPIILMHMRGTPQTMTKLTTYTNGDVVEGVATELARRVRAAEKAGIHRWNMILDPGLGFAKTGEQNLAILRELRYLVHSRPEFAGLPWLVGPSRKGFIGKITGTLQPKDRVFGTGGAVAACITGGAEIIRVHDVKEMTDVVKVLDEIYRKPIVARKGYY
ncbi:Dihydropteroate synthase-like protein [Limtongia smithiae]|uniref:Dihydropteroate synthase-like protein n=1 Tax=Limtongia smithiae TaxID=1125753 RepID=UPI0034CFD5CE